MVEIEGNDLQAAIVEDNNDVIFFCKGKKFSFLQIIHNAETEYSNPNIYIYYIEVIKKKKKLKKEF